MNWNRLEPLSYRIGVNFFYVFRPTPEKGIVFIVMKGELYNYILNFYELIHDVVNDSLQNHVFMLVLIQTQCI